MFIDRFLFFFIWNFMVFSVSSVGRTESDLTSSCNQSDCLRCDLDTNECAKCLHVMMVPSRTCKEKCPHGFDPIWAEESDIFGRICQERSVLAMVSYREVGIIAGVSVLGAIGVGIFLGVLLLRNKVKVPPDSPPRGLPRLLQDKRPKTVEVVIKGKERTEFLSRLRHLRTESPYIVRMVTSTRNKFRSRNPLGPETAPSDAKTKACKAVVRDLSRVLCLLSLKEEYLQTAPKDWRSLLSWTERLLARYKRQEEIKERGENNQYSTFRGGQGHVRLNKSLFITREQQLKADKDKRRLENDPSSTFPDVGAEENNKCSTPVEFRQDKMISDDTFKSWELEEHLEEKSPCSQKARAKKIKNFFNTNKNLWLKILLRKNKAENDLEKGDDDIINSTKNDLANDFTFDDDDIPSQTFFDHIEAFAFDLDDDMQDSNQSSPELNCNRVNDADVNADENLKNNYKNNLNLFKNYQSRQMKSDIRSGGRENHAARYTNNRVKKHSFDKPTRISKLRRISSSFLSKDKKLLSLRQEYSKPKKRRPLKRQKRVEKETHSKIIEKYKIKSNEEEEDSGTLNADNLVTTSSSFTSNKNGEDNNFISVINSPNKSPHRTQKTDQNLDSGSARSEDSLSRSPSTTSGSESESSVDNTNHLVDQFDNSQINIIHKPPYSNQYNNQNVYKNSCDTYHSDQFYTRCEILTNV